MSHQNFAFQKTNLLCFQPESGRIIKLPESFKCLRIKLSSRSALKTRPVIRFIFSKRSANVTMFATEKFCQKADLFTENTYINYRFFSIHKII